MRAQATDEIYIEAHPRDVITALTRLSSDHAWWPGARAEGAYGWVRISAPTGGRGERVTFKASIGAVREWEGFPWTLDEGELVGRAEWWIEAFGSGSIVHYYLDAERGDRGRWRRASSVLRRHRWAIRGGVNALKDMLEARGPA